MTATDANDRGLEVHADADARSDVARVSPDASVAPGPDVDPLEGQEHTGARRLVHPAEWGWRRRIRANRQTYQAYRAIVAGVGLVVVVVGLIAVPLPGPGWLIVFIGVSIWASEFHWARRLHESGMRTLRRWNQWVMRQHISVRGGLAVLTCLFVNAVLWTTLRISGIPAWAPEPVTAFLHAHLGL